jgi:hypothetical protein
MFIVCMVEREYWLVEMTELCEVGMLVARMAKETLSVSETVRHVLKSLHLWCKKAEGGEISYSYGPERIEGTQYF